VILEVVAHVQLVQPPTHPALRTTVMQRVVQRVVDDVPDEERGRERPGEPADATTYTAHFVDGHVGAATLGGAALTHGFEITFYVLAGFAFAGALVAALLIERKPKVEDVQQVVPEGALFEAA
jgi:hypothetical protein